MPTKIKKKIEGKNIKKKVFKPAPVKDEKPEETKEAEEQKGKKGAKIPNLLRGMKDSLPREFEYWKKMRGVAESISEAYGFGEIETPILEEASLFIRSVGKGTDIVDKEMYVFEDLDGTKVSLRPEFTASIVRAYINHGMHNLPQPVKLWQWGSLFRHDRPQAGRYRQFHQYGCEVLGEHDPYVDAELISVAYNFLRDLGINAIVHVNSIGTVEDRQRYVAELVGYLRTKRSYLCEDCKKRLVKNPLRVLDCKVEQCAKVIEDAPQIVDWLSETSKNFFMKVLEYLDEIGIPYMLRSTLVRGLDYYTDTVFELYQESTENAGAQSALGGGGRYDLLVEQLGGRTTPASGFALGLERVAAVVRQMSESGQNQNIPKESTENTIFLAHLGEQARRKALGILEFLRRKNIKIKHNLGKTSLKGQMELANKYRATHTIIIGQKEVQDGTVIIRNMESGIQEIIDQKKLDVEILKIQNSSIIATSEVKL